MKVNRKSACGWMYFAALLMISLFTEVKAENSELQANIYKQFSALQCDSLVKANETNPDFIILDVRTPAEWNNYHLLGSINHSTGSGTFDAELAALPKHKRYLLHCQSGSRSAGAFTKMKNLGFAEVYEMKSGISAWRNAGLPTTTAAGPKLMVVSVIKNKNNTTNDTTKVTVTNRANGVLVFSNISFSDGHTVQTDFNGQTGIAGAQDYSFFVVHPAGLGDTTGILLESNGGNINLTIENSISTYADFNSFSQIKLYPNPVSNRLFFDAGNELIEEITISDLTGKQLAILQPARYVEDIDVSAFKNGIYVARIKFEQRITTRKFVVKH